MLGIQRTAGNGAAAALVRSTRSSGTQAPREAAGLIPGSLAIDRTGSITAEDAAATSVEAVPGGPAPVAAGAAAGDGPGRGGGVQRLTVQRNGPDSQETRDAGLVQAIAMLNSAGAVKLAFSARPKRVVEAGVVEVKKAAVEIEGTVTFAAPALSGATAPVAVGGGASRGRSQETGAEGRTGQWATSYAAEIKGKADPILPAALDGVIDWKLTAAQWTPGKELNTGLAISIDNAVVSASVTWNILKVDLEATEPDQKFKPVSATIKLGTGKFLEFERKQLLTIGGNAIDAKARLKISGSVEVGPNWDKLAYEVARVYGGEAGTELFRRNLAVIAQETADKSVREIAYELAEEACKDIPDAAVREGAVLRAHERAMAEAEKRGVRGGIIPKIEDLSTRSVGDAASVRVAMEQAARQAARDQMREFSPTLAQLVYEELKAFGKDAMPEFLKKRLGSKAELAEEALKVAGETLDAEVKRLAEEATKDIADEAARAEAKTVAERQIAAELEAKGLKTEATVAAERAGAGAAQAGAAAAARSARRAAMREAVLEAIGSTLRRIGPDLVKSVGRGLAELSLKRAAMKVATHLAGGPADFVLVGIELLAAYIDTILKDQEVKVAGLTAVRMRDNFVQAYTRALAGPVAGKGQGGGGDNPEGQAYLVGVQKGTDQYEKVVEETVRDLHVERSELEQVLKAKPISVDASKINAQAGAAVKNLMYSAFAKRHSGFFTSEEEVLQSDDFKAFKGVVESNLDKNGRITFASLANGVSVKLIALDSTSDRAQEFRTVDGRYSGVSIRGSTRDLSGWITADGVPLEEIYRAQGEADAANAGELDRTQRMAQMLAASTIEVQAPMLYTPTPRITGARISTPSTDDPSFVDYLHEPDALGKTLGGCGARIIVTGPLPTGSSGGFYRLTAIGGQVQGAVGRADFLANPSATAIVQGAGIDPAHPNATAAYLDYAWGTHLASRTLASLPKLA